MARKAFVLISCEAAKVVDATKTLCQKPGIMSAEAVTGNYDIIATVQSSDVEAVAKTVLMEIAGVPGIKSTNTCVVIPIE